MKNPFYVLVFTALISCVNSLLAQSAAKNPQELWSGFDPDAGDFKEQIVREETNEGIYQRDSYISAYVQGQEIRVYCKYSVKSGSRNAPGLLDVHGWMGSPNPDKDFVNDGWAVMAHDYCGMTKGREDFTKYPDAMRHGNMDAKFGHRVKSQTLNGSPIMNPTETDDYLWYAIQRRVLSYLISQKEVDANRIGAKGYSYGGTLMWNLAMDSRVKAVAAYFGVGWLEYYRTQRVWMYEQNANQPRPNAGESLYLATIAPQSHAPYITAATLWLNGTNDHHGGHERGEKTFEMMQDGVPWSFAHQPRAHHDTTNIGHNTKLWLGKHVLDADLEWPEQSESSFSLDTTGVPLFTVTPADPEQVVDLQMYYAIKNPVSYGRAWRDVSVQRRGKQWAGKMPVLNVDDYVFAFANIVYKNSVVRSSSFTAAIPSELGDAKATDRLSEQLDSAGTSWLNVGPVQGKDGVRGFRVLNARGTFNEQFSDPKWKSPKDAQLSFRFFCTEPQKLTVSVNQHWKATVFFPASNDWQKKSLPAALFMNQLNQQPLQDWTQTRRIEMKADGNADITKIIFADFQWEQPLKRKAERQMEAKPSKPTAMDRVYLTREMASDTDTYVRVVNDGAWDGGLISIGGKIFRRGLGVHARSKLVFPLGGLYETFSVVPGPDDAHHGQIEMKVLVDDRQVWSSGSTRSVMKREPSTLNISVRDAETLSLIVEVSDGDRGGDHASWGDAHLTRVSDASAPSQTRGDKLSEVREKLRPFFQKYCFECHGLEKQEAQVQFEQIAWEIRDNDSAQRWQDALDQLNGGDMPPEQADQPDSAELADALDLLTGALIEARRRLTDHGGEVQLRRLNRREYSNSIRDLFGFDVLPDDIPSDGEIATFDTVGAEQLFTSAHFEQYLELGKQIASEAFKFNTQPYRKVTIDRVEPEQRVTEKMREKLADLDRKMAWSKEGKSWQEMGFKDEGEMEIVFQQWDARAEVPRQYLRYPHVDRGVYNCDVAKWVSISKHVDIRGEYILRLNGGIAGKHDPLRKIARIWDRDRIRGTVPISGTPENPQTVETRLRQPMNRYHMSVKIRENVPENTINSMRGYVNRLEGNGARTDPRAAIWVDWMEIEGPFYPEHRPRFEDILYPNLASGTEDSMLGDDGRARELIEQFSYQAFRRVKPEKDYLDQLHRLFLVNRESGLDYQSAMSDVIGVILASPGFLFLQEQGSKEASEARGELNDRELAVRLAYFLWSSPPDDELYEANLSDPEIYSQQVDRMLADPKVKGFRDGFINQWADLDRYDAITIDNREHFRFNEGLQQDAKQEVREFFGVLLDENLPASNLIESDFLMINSTLAAHYGIDPPSPGDSGFQKVFLPADSPRGGMLTQTAFLVTGSNGERSSPVIRGALVMEKLLHDKPAPPPPNVPELGSTSTMPRTNRELVELHQTKAVCASCHKKMDVIGFGLENFDATGAWRDNEKVGGNAFAIQPAGKLPNGKAFSDASSLKERLLEEKEQLAEELVESILSYAIGRTIEFSDSDHVAALVNRLKADDFRIRSMVREIASSKLFRTK